MINNMYLYDAVIFKRLSPLRNDRNMVFFHGTTVLPLQSKRFLNQRDSNEFLTAYVLFL